LIFNIRHVDCGLNSLDAEQLLADSSDTGTLALPENFAAIADACMSVLTGRVNNVPAVIAEVFHPFAPGFGRFRAVFERQGKAGHANVNGKTNLFILHRTESDCQLFVIDIQVRCVGLRAPCRVQPALQSCRRTLALSTKWF